MANHTGLCRRPRVSLSVEVTDDNVTLTATRTWLAIREGDLPTAPHRLGSGSSAYSRRSEIQGVIWSYSIACRAFAGTSGWFWLRAERDYRGGIMTI